MWHVGYCVFLLDLRFFEGKNHSNLSIYNHLFLKVWKKFSRLLIKGSICHYVTLFTSYFMRYKRTQWSKIFSGWASNKLPNFGRFFSKQYGCQNNQLQRMKTKRNVIKKCLSQICWKEFVLKWEPRIIRTLKRKSFI